MYKQPEKDNPISEWKPFTTGNLKKIDAEDETVVNGPNAKPEEGFSILYEADKKETEVSDFVSLYSRDVNKKNLSDDKSSKNKKMQGKTSDPSSQPQQPAKPDPPDPPAPQPVVQQIDTKEIERKAYEKGFEKGQKEGFSKGEKDGYNAGKANIDDMIGRLKGVLEELNGLWTNLINANEKQIILLICKVAEKVIHGYVEADHDVIKRAILNAFKLIPEPIDITINVNPDDYEYIEAVKTSFFEQIKDLKNISIISDPSVSKGGAKIETKGGKIDATLESRLESVKQSIIETYGKK